MRMTPPIVYVALVLANDPFDRHWGYELSRRSGIRSGVMYPVLDRMLEAGWLVDGWEPTYAAVKRPRRRYYELTDAGRAAINELLEHASGDPRFAMLPGFSQ